MKNYQKENCSGKAQHFTRPLNLLFKEHPAAQTRWHFTSSPGQTWQFTRQRHQFTSSNCQFTSSPDSGTSRGHPHCFSLLQLNLCGHLTYKYVANCVQNFHISTWAQTSMRLLPAGTTSEIRCRKSASRRPVVSWASSNYNHIGWRTLLRS